VRAGSARLSRLVGGPVPDLLLGERDLDPLDVEGGLDALAQQPADPPLLAGRRLDDEAQRDAVDAQLLDAPQVGRLQHGRVRLGDLAGDALDDRLGVVEVGAVGDLDVQQRARPVLAHVAHAADVAVGHVPDGAVDAAQPRGAQADGLDGAGRGGVEVDDVADAELVLDEDEDARQEVLDQRLGAEAQRDADDAGAGQQGRQVDAELAEDHQPGDDEDDEARDAGENAAQRLDALLGA
jgi:hypothetical protein